MTTYDKFFGRMALFFTVYGIVWTVIALLEPEINMYKVLFWLVTVIYQSQNYLAYKWNGN